MTMEETGYEPNHMEIISHPCSETDTVVEYVHLEAIVALAHGGASIALRSSMA